MKKLWLTIGFIAFLSGLIVITLVENAGAPREPEYDGKRLTAWLDILGDESLINRNTNTEFAVKQMGTNAVPFLIQMLYVKDSPFKRKCMQLLERQHWVDFHFRYDFQKQSEAGVALAILGPDAKAAIPDLANLLKEHGEGELAVYALSRIGPDATPVLENALTNSDPEVRGYAVAGLGALGEPSSVSNILVALKDPEWTVRASAASALRRFPGQAKVIVPALINGLDDPSYVVQVHAARALGTFGTNAMPAFPRLLEMVGSTNEVVSRAATEALNEIDPQAAAKLNGK